MHVLAVRITSFAASAVLAFAVGCGSRSTASDAAASGGPEVSKGTGIIFVTQPPPSPPKPAYTITADFSGSLPAGSGDACKETIVGPCTLTACTGTGMMPQPPALQAGTITVTTPEATAKLAPGPGPAYKGAMGTTPLWKSAGETLTVAASGGDIAAFTMMATTPGSINVISPAFPSAPMKLPVSTSKDLSFTWSGKGPGTVSVFIVVQATGVYASCDFDAAAGQATVPASLMGQLPKGNGAISVDLSSTTVMDVGGYQVTLRVDTGLLAGGPATFQ